MNWLDKLDEVADRVTSTRDKDSIRDGSSSTQSESAARSLHESLALFGRQMSESISGPNKYRVKRGEPAEESSDHFSSIFLQPGRQYSTSLTMPLEPDSSMLNEDDDDGQVQVAGELDSASLTCSLGMGETVADGVSITQGDAEPRLLVQTLRCEVNEEEAIENAPLADDEADRIDHFTTEDTTRRTAKTLLDKSPKGGSLLKLMALIDPVDSNIDETTTHAANVIREGDSAYTRKSPLADTEMDKEAVPGQAIEVPPSTDEFGVPGHVTGKKDEDFSDFEVLVPPPDWDSGIPLDQSLNCYGVVHVRLVSAQRLPCPTGSSVQGIVALPPWKGRVRTERTTAFVGPEHAGVCVRWDQLHEGGCCAMVHAWNSVDTPIPTIKLDLVFHPLQMLEFPMCSVSLSCAPLMRTPVMWKKQWCNATVSQKLNDPDGFLAAEEHIPLILLEAMFVPADFESIAEPNAGDFQELHNDDLSVCDSPSSSTVASRSAVPHGSSIASGSTFLLSARQKPHLLRMQSFWVPALCCVCRKVIAGFRCGFRCEACNIDCCNDCQLQVDLQVPCGSHAAKESAAHSLHNKLTVNSIMNAIAPWNDDPKKPLYEMNHGRTASVQRLGSAHHTDTEADSGEDVSIGTLRMQILQARLFEQHLSPESNTDALFQENDGHALRNGDYYIRISSKGSKQNMRTRTIQNTGKPIFDTDEFVFHVPHYAMEYRVDVVDARTDKPIGMSVVTTQGLLQQQRDSMVEAEGLALAPFFQKPPICIEMRRLRLELRSGIQSGFSDEFFVSTARGTGGHKKGEISGWIDVDICLTERTDRLYGSHPLECPARPPADLNVDMFQAHVARLGMLADDVKSGIASLSYVMSWNNPALTLLSATVFVSLCLRFNAEYVGCLPFSFIIAYMLYLATVRRGRRFKERFLERERKTSIDSEKQVSVKYGIHRPIGRLSIAVNKGKNIRSRELGIPGNAGSRIYWDPLRHCNSRKEKESLISVDSSLAASHEIGLSNFVYSADPVWNEMNESEETKRLQQLLPSNGEFFGIANDEVSSKPNSGTSRILTSKRKHDDCIFPILQPITAAKRKSTVTGEGGVVCTAVDLQPWDVIQGAVVIEVRFHNVINKLPGFDDVLGEVSFPVSELITNGETRGWYQIHEQGTQLQALPGTRKESSTDTDAEFEPPQVYVDIKWLPPESEAGNVESEKEASIVVAEELIRSAARTQSNKGIDLMGSSIGAFNTMAGLSGHVQMIQNTLGSVLDTVESIRNAFNFTDPYKSSVVLCMLVVLWLFLAVVPTRVLILLGGLAQYIITFVVRFGPSHSGEGKRAKIESVVDAREEEKSPFVVWIMNALRGLPTDEDLRKAYFWESRRVGEHERARLAEEKRTARLKRLWRAQWYSTVQIKTRHGRTSSSPVRDWHWQEAFAIVQGRRFLWWRSVHDFDNGEAPTGRIFLAGHAGLAGLSPLELRQLDEKEKTSVVSIFGRGLDGQQKLTLSIGVAVLKEQLEQAVLEASTKQD